jgi:hypothetical protein
MEDIENRLRIVGLQSALQGQESLVTPTRKLLREWTVQEVRGKKASERRAGLLTDVLVVVKVKQSGLGQGSVFQLNRISVAAVADSSANLRHCFEVTFPIGPKREKRRFSMVSAAERDTFVSLVVGQGNATLSSGGGSGSGAPLVRESSSTVLSSQGSNDSLPKKGIFQKLRSTRTLSVGGEDGPPTIGEPSSAPSSSPPPKESINGSSAPSSSVGTTAASSTTALSRATLASRGSSATVAAAGSASTGHKSPRAQVTRESSPRVPVAAAPSAPEERRSPRSWATASAPSAGEESGGGLTRESSPGSLEQTTQLVRGSSVMCAACGEAVVGSALNSKGKFFHSQCYKCHECSKSLLGIPFAEKKGEIFCRECALALFAEPCSGCGKMITGQFLAAFGEKYHPACFVCAAGCGTNVSRGYAKRDGKAYCRNCAKERP